MTIKIGELGRVFTGVYTPQKIYEVPVWVQVVGIDGEELIVSDRCGKEWIVKKEDFEKEKFKCTHGEI